MVVTPTPLSVDTGCCEKDRKFLPKIGVTQSIIDSMFAYFDLKNGLAWSFLTASISLCAFLNAGAKCFNDSLVFISVSPHDFPDTQSHPTYLKPILRTNL